MCLNLIWCQRIVLSGKDLARCVLSQLAHDPRLSGATCHLHHASSTGTSLQASPLAVSQRRIGRRIHVVACTLIFKMVLQVKLVYSFPSSPVQLQPSPCVFRHIEARACQQNVVCRLPYLHVCKGTGAHKRERERDTTKENTNTIGRGQPPSMSSNRTHSHIPKLFHGMGGRKLGI